ncbi:hypothetical protein ACN38_g7592 [Penicillium nordicum]|uniref:Uncharacterized protein n=1 Tax=Penicillium nordicum TaxID=229535 RepID=A0A0M8P6R4_9EURO|nr:hypothetical protein ACN38_g7592 [Penicillium nordicum]
MQFNGEAVIVVKGNDDIVSRLVRLVSSGHDDIVSSRLVGIDVHLRWDILLPAVTKCVYSGALNYAHTEEYTRSGTTISILVLSKQPVELDYYYVGGEQRKNY